MRKTLLAMLTAGVLTLAGLAPPALAQWIVFDPSNYSQNMLTAARTLQQINNQIRQLQNEALMLTNQARNLTGLNFSTLTAMRTALASTNQLIQQAQGMAYNVSSMDAQFARLYPQTYASTVSGSSMAADARQRWTMSLEALQTSMQMQAQASQNFAVDEAALTDLVNNSQSAVGQLQATQATNQLLALQSRQAIQEQQLRITQDRATALEQARSVATEARSRAVRRSFLGDGTNYTPQTVDFYSN